MKIKLKELRTIIKSELSKFNVLKEEQSMHDRETWQLAHDVKKLPGFKWEIGMQTFDQLDGYSRLEDDDDVEYQYSNLQRQSPDITDQQTVHILRRQVIAL